MHSVIIIFRQMLTFKLRDDPEHFSCSLIGFDGHSVLAQVFVLHGLVVVGDTQSLPEFQLGINKGLVFELVENLMQKWQEWQLVVIFEVVN